MEAVLIGEYIRETRTVRLGLGRRPFADLMGVVMQTVKRYEEGKTRPKRWFLEKLEQIRRSPVVIQLRKFTRETRKRWELIKARGNRTQREIARILGIDFTRLSQWENGHPVPEKWIVALCSIYQKSKYVLFPDIFGQKENRLQAA